MRTKDADPGKWGQTDESDDEERGWREQSRDELSLDFIILTRTSQRYTHGESYYVTRILYHVFRDDSYTWWFGGLETMEGREWTQLSEHGSPLLTLAMARTNHRLQEGAVLYKADGAHYDVFKLKERIENKTQIPLDKKTIVLRSMTKIVYCK